MNILSNPNEFFEQMSENEFIRFLEENGFDFEANKEVGGLVLNGEVIQVEQLEVLLKIQEEISTIAYHEFIVQNKGLVMECNVYEEEWCYGEAA